MQARLAVVAVLAVAVGTLLAAAVLKPPADVPAQDVVTTSRPAPFATRVPVSRVQTASRPAALEIPAIGVDTSTIVGLGLTPDGALERPADARTPGWFTGGPTPGERGPAVLAARDGVFGRLKDARPGEQVVVHRADHTAAVFTVYRVDHPPNPPFPTARSATPAPELRLITVDGDNVVVYARLSQAFTS
ncbi:sortase domain-bontaining protein [Amycolatopsis sp. FDAARGOS 1241]|uniref:sortase domain-containing protein n=1 Tax=Amycolatopsis sp. FDAARGOS 1241 TaxID=2778070 RepID=UPI00194F5720|nr:sortase [Amycolatopsis sp. FDAARGOS 1241]QRP45888.1 class F sortase [Amycolatopsis sp. FDAARGOS 1241]